MKKIILIVSLLLFIVTPIYAAYKDDTRMLMDTGEDSGGGGGGGVAETTRTLKEILKDFFSRKASTDNPGTINKGTPGNTQDTSTGEGLPEKEPVPSRTPGGLEVNQTFTALDDLYEDVGNRMNVPACLIKAISYIEYRAVFDYTPEQVAEYQTPGKKIPNCPWNSCSAAGHMQMTMGKDETGSTACNRCCWNGKCQNKCPDAWTPYGKAVSLFGGASHKPDVCNLRDSTFAAAMKLKQDSNSDKDSINWKIEQIEKAAKSYYGNCTVTYPRLDNLTYCGYAVQECKF